MPTVLACAVASVALLIAVGLQAPAVSVGLRWKPETQTRTYPPIPPWEMNGAIPNFEGGSSEPSRMKWVLLALIAFGLLALVVRWIRNRLPRPIHVARLGADSGVVSEAGAQILQSGLAAAIQSLSADDRDLGNAVVQAWQSLQDAAATAGLHRRPAETASEFTARILYRSRRSAEPIAALLSLYQRVRFGEHSPHPDEIAAARHSLLVLVGLWEADFPKRRLPTVTR